MSAWRAVPLAAHVAIVALAAPAIMAAPFLFGFGLVPTVISVALGALLLGLALQVDGHGLPLSAQAGFEYALATVALAAGIGVGIAGGELAATVFLVGVGTALVSLTASTRFSYARRAPGRPTLP